MTGARVVRSGDGAYAVAVAELPLRARRGVTVEGAIVVIGGEVGWGRRVRQALDDGAAAIVLSDPVSIAGDEQVEASGAERRAPVIVDRPRLRMDVRDDAGRPGRPPRAVQVECSAALADVEAVLRDGIGWARTLAGGALELVTVRETPRGLTVLLERPAGIDLDSALTATIVLGRREASPWLRGLAIDVVRTEVIIEDATGTATVDIADRGGHSQPPPRYERSERLSLRRALDALDGGEHPLDLSELEHDSALGRLILARARGINESDTGDSHTRIP
ncbi:hypothetical protein [Lacisediminihabitans sp.]|uniref:hypothetical protein n=1 Tax=Lacisediminihabitans sp. TaxID=2787631 RepID=UPI00374D3E7E